MRLVFWGSVMLLLSKVSFSQFERVEKAKDIFSVYKPPVIDSEVFDRLERDDKVVYLGCYVTTDSTGKVVTQKVVPLEGIGNDYLVSDTIWTAIKSSVIQASRGWLFKPILWKFEGDKKMQDDFNSKVFQRPFTGKPRYFIVIEISGVPHAQPINKVSFVSAFEVANK